MKNRKFIEFEEIARCLDRCIQFENKEIMVKGFMPSNIKKSLRIYIHSCDHNPVHFHVESEQRKFDQKFSVGNIENISKIKDHRFDEYIKKFFQSSNGFLEKVVEEFYRLNPELKIK